MLKKSTVVELAQIGAQLRMAELTREQQSILALFPGADVAALAPVPSRHRQAAPPKRRAARNPSPTEHNARPPMTDAQREAISKRMKKRWKMYHAEQAAQEKAN